MNDAQAIVTSSSLKACPSFTPAFSCLTDLLWKQRYQGFSPHLGTLPRICLLTDKRSHLTNLWFAQQLKMLRSIQTTSYSRCGWSVACLKNGQATVIKKRKFSNGKRKVLETKNFWSLAHSTVISCPLTTHKDVLLLALAAAFYSVAFWEKLFFCMGCRHVCI